MYKEYLAEFWYSAKALKESRVSFSMPSGGIHGKLGLNTFRNAIGAHYLSHPSEYVAPPSINDVREWFSTIRYGEVIFAKGTLKKSLLPPKWRLLMGQIIQCLEDKTGGYDQISNKDAIILYSLANGVNVDYANIFWEDLIIKLNKKIREKVVPYTRFVSLLLAHKMKEDYRNGKVTHYPTQTFSVLNWALKPNTPAGPSFTTHMLAICNTDELVPLKAPKPSLQTEMKVSKGKNPRAQAGSSEIPTRSKSKEPKSSACKRPAGSHKSHSKKRKESSQAMDSNPSRPPVSTPVDTGLHKEVQQAVGGPTSLGVTSEE
ncbi:hypothetical protein Tco_1174470 [Tanacetum coccineum]